MAQTVSDQSPVSEHLPQEPPNAEPISEHPVASDLAYSVFTVPQKKTIVVSAALGAAFSPMSTTIYLPALNEIAGDLNVSSSKINLTVTTFLILQGVAPMMIAGFSDGAGRRPAYIYCFIVYIAANIGLALQRNYAALLVLRCLQSAGSSGTVALCNGVVADLVTSAERGMYIGYTSVPAIVGPIVGPIIGGVIAQYLGWWWIFWFLTICSVTYFVLFFLFLPETCRKVVGDGSIPPPKLNQSLTGIIRERRRIKAGIAIDTAQQEAVRKSYRLRFPNPLSTLIIAGDKESGLILFCSGLLVAILYATTTGIPYLFGKIYNFNELQLGLVYVPFGAGSLISAFSTGKAIDWNYRRHAKRIGFPLTKNRHQDLTDFPIERARLEVALPLLYIGNIGSIAYGWTLDFRTNLAGPLILLFVCGYGSMAAFQVMQILIVDINPGNAASSTAANNLFRCLLGAGSTAVVVPMIDRMGVGWTYTFASLVWIALSPSLWLLMKYGPGWRKEKKEKEDRLEDRVREEKVAEAHAPEAEEQANIHVVAENECAPAAEPTKLDYKPKGTYIKLAGLDVYAIGPVNPTRALIAIYDIFGLLPQTLQGADLLSHSLNALILMPDFFKGNALPLNLYPPDTDEKKKFASEFMQGPANIDANVHKLAEVMLEAKKSNSSVKSWGCYGLCWGGKLAALSSAAGTEFRVAGTAHPGRLVKEEAEKLTIPLICLFSKEDGTPELVEEYGRALEKKKENVVETYGSMHHGWMGARANLGDGENLREYERGYTQLAEFFAKHL